jgi:hypothetical protein
LAGMIPHVTRACSLPPHRCFVTAANWDMLERPLLKIVRANR